MIKKIILLLLLTCLPVFAEYNPLSDAPINSVNEFYADDEVEQPEFEYPASDNYEPVEVVNSKPSKNYPSIYNNLEEADFAYMHDIDPDQFYDIKDTAWAPYPLFRLNSPIYFKKTTIEPGYYLLTPREHNGKWYLLFKQNGKVAHIVPVYERDITPEFFYDKHIAKPKLKPSQKVHMGILSSVGKLKKSKRRDPIQSYLEVNDLENHFVSIIIYYGSHKYSTIFRTIRL